MGLDPAGTLTDDLLAGLPPGPDWSLLLEIGDGRYLVRVVDGTVRCENAPGINATWDVGFAVSDAEWAEFCADPPPRGATSAQALVATRGSERITGRREVWARAAPAIDRFLDALRGTERAPRPDPAPPPPGFGPSVGRYLHLDDGRRIFVETAGEGPPLLCLHTAGADSRQFRGLLEDSRVTDHHRVVAFDMPWHGRSDPPDDWQHRRYTLDTATYAATVLAVADTLELERPVLLGCSMGGAIALYLAAEHGERFAGVCALEGGLGSAGRFVEWTHRADVDHSGFLASWVGGLIAPSSPEGPRAQTLWGYASNGPGVYQGDTAFYSIDFPPIAAALGRATCPLYVFSGEYDYSATTEMSRKAAEQLGGELVVMPGRGHFPMSEDPEGLLEHLLPVLEVLRVNEVLAVRYGTRVTTRGEAYLNWHVYGEPDESFRMDYFFWVVRVGGRTTVVDCGFDPEVGRRRGREVLVDPVEALAALGVDAATVDRLVVSHAHYDHIGNLHRFPAAEIVMTSRELAFWTGPHAARVQFAHSTEAGEIAALARAHDEGRVTTFSGYCELGDGFGLLEVGGHTPGQLIGRVAVDGGEVVLAADALHFYDELTEDRPFFVVADLEAMYAGFDTLRDLTDVPGRVLVAGHDTDVGRRFPGRAQGTGIDDLVIRLDVEGSHR